MRTDDLHQRLQDTLGAVIPAPAPVDGVVRKGKRIRLRRRITAAASVAAVVAAGVLIPRAVHWQASPAPATGHYVVTVAPPGPHAPAGEIATGTINGKPWQITAERPGTDCGRGQQSVRLSGAAFAPDYGGLECMPALAADPSSPVGFAGPDSRAAQALFGAVRRDVTFVTITLGNGTVLTLRPVTAYGVRLVAFAIPLGNMIVREATAYSRTGVIATAVPFASGTRDTLFGAWLRPGQQGLIRASGRIALSPANGKNQSVRIETGPWGVCIVEPDGSSADCTEFTTAPMDTSVILSSEGPANLVFGSASASVVRIVAGLTGGTTIQVRPVNVGGTKYWAIATRKNVTVTSWTAYDGAGRVVAHT